MMAYGYSKGTETEINRLSHVCGAIRRHLRNKSREETQMKFYKTVVARTLQQCTNSETCVTKKKQKKERRIQHRR